ncbi:hypothetical protein AVEN_101442-1 [Araneus ventricosus]|uniref:Uncharacterized protein n=1 Tax=Araneus ventricosus TaxID=182803 RepID=A0A4Y2CWU2_ARAVE|nr:hypothetical protein AVEN_101442-1 [Araneus ventricosus]
MTRTIPKLAPPLQPSAPHQREDDWPLGGQTPPADEVWMFVEVSAAQVSSSSDLGSKLRSPSQNSSRVASKRDFNLPKTKL